MFMAALAGVKEGLLEVRLKVPTFLMCKLWMWQCIVWSWEHKSVTANLWRAENTQNSWKHTRW